MLFKIAWRNIWRNRKRSLVMLSAVAIGLWAGIFLMAFYNGMIEDRIRSAIESEVSHIQIHPREFRKEYDIRLFLKNSDRILSTLKARPEVKAVSGRIVVKGMVASASGSSGITVNAVNPEAEAQLTGLPKKLTIGNYFDSTKHNEILISEKLSKKLKVGHRKKVILTFQDSLGNLSSGAFRITGLFKTVNGPYDDNNVFVQVRDIVGLTGIGDTRNEVAILLNDRTDLEQETGELKKLFPETEVLDWKEIAPELGLTASVGDQMVLIFMGIILLALAFGIINTMLMAVIERSREIGMLMALGMNRVRIFSMILLETLFLILSGCPAGILLALGTVFITGTTGIDLSAYLETYSAYGYKPIIYPELTLRQFGLSMVLVVVTALISGVFPAFRALRLNPAESLKK